MDNLKLLNKFRKLTGDVIYTCVVKALDSISTNTNESKFAEDLFRTWEIERLPPDQRNYNRYDSEGNVMLTTNGREMKKRRIVSIGTKAKFMLEYLLCTFAIECNAFGVPETPHVYGELNEWSRKHYEHPVSPIFIEIWTRYRSIVEPFYVGEDYEEWIIDEMSDVIMSDKMREIFASVASTVIHAIAVWYSRLKWEAKTPFHERSITAILVGMTMTMDYEFAEEYITHAKDHKKDHKIEWLPNRATTPDPNIDDE